MLFVHPHLKSQRISTSLASLPGVSPHDSYTQESSCAQNPILDSVHCTVWLLWKLPLRICTDTTWIDCLTGKRVSSSHKANVPPEKRSVSFYRKSDCTFTLLSTGQGRACRAVCCGAPESRQERVSQAQLRGMEGSHRRLDV